MEIFFEDTFEEEIKIIPKVETEPLYEKYLRGTKKLKGNFMNEELKIENNTRIFKSIEKDYGYDEVFLNDKPIIFSGISKNISFLFPLGNRITNNRIGYRFYKDNPLEYKNEIPYFTLVLISNREFHILEKDAKIKDNMGNEFIENNLDCLEIMLEIIKNKFVKKTYSFNISYPYSLVELLGFCYAIKTKKYNNIEILKPYFPDPFIPETKIEDFDRQQGIFYVEPILYNKHISLLVFCFTKQNRVNRLFDMSSIHYDKMENHDPIFLSQMTINLKKYPKNVIQSGPSSSIWFIASLLTLLKNDIKDNKDSNILFNVIKTLFEIMSIKDTPISQKLIFEREFENIAVYHFISYNIIFYPFINPKGLILELYENINNELTEFFQHYHILFSKLRKKIAELEINQIYYKINSSHFDENLIKIYKDRYYIAQSKFIDLINIKLQITMRKRGQVIKIDEKYISNCKTFKKDNMELTEFLEEPQFNVINQHIFTFEEIYHLLISNNDIFLEPYNM